MRILTLFFWNTLTFFVSSKAKYTIAESKNKHLNPRSNSFSFLIPISFRSIVYVYLFHGWQIFLMVNLIHFIDCLNQGKTFRTIYFIWWKWKISNINDSIFYKMTFTITDYEIIENSKQWDIVLIIQKYISNIISCSIYYQYCSWTKTFYKRNL